MAFNHYAKITRILATQPKGWYIVRIDEPTTAKNFKGEVRSFDHYYRVYGNDNLPIKYCKFQQIQRFSAAVNVPVEVLPIYDEPLA